MRKTSICPGILVILLAVLILTSLTAAHAGVVYVRTDGDDTNSGASWTLAKKTVQAGINTAVSGDQVWVGKGSYTERITLESGVAVYGGFAGSEIDLNQRPAFPRAASDLNATVLDGNQGGSVVTSSGNDASTRIDGFTIKNGDSSKGGGIYCYSSYLVVCNNIITGNDATGGYGGGIYSSGGTKPTISNNIFTGNKSNGGGAICCDCSSPVITNNIITANSEQAIYCQNSSSTIANNYIVGNSSGGGGGAVFCNESSPKIINNTIVGNNVGAGGCVWCVSSSSPVIANNIIAYNSAGIYNDGYFNNPVLRNNCVYNPDRYNYYGIQAGQGDISVDPGLVAAAYGQVHLQAGAPCIDAGDDTRVTAGWLDIDGQNRIQGAHVDIGADESDGNPRSYTPVIIRVKPTGNNSNDGTSWALAKRTIQAAVDAAAAQGGEVWVAAGTYTQPVFLKEYVYIYGGFSGTENSKLERNWRVNKTIIDGSYTSDVVFVLDLGHKLTCVDGFTIWGGSGSGIYCRYSAPLISHNIITSNSGSGIHTYYCSPDINNNFITGNGGGLYLIRCFSRIANNTIVGNSAIDGGGIYIKDGSSPDICNNIITFNSSGIYNDTTANKPTLRYNNFYNPDSWNYMGCSKGAGDISQDPKLAAVDFGEVHVMPGSPCIDAGDDTAVTLGMLDIDTQSRISGSHVDMGADESDGSAPAFAPVTVMVSPQGSDTNSGLGWGSAKRTVQAGIREASKRGGEVWVKTGTYNERITLKAYAYLYGGFAGTESARTGRDWKLYVTILDGGAGGSVVRAYCGHKYSAIDGFTIRNGTGTLYSNYYFGGGIYCGYASPTISNNFITANTVPHMGGGISVFGHCVTISNNTISGNTANRGGGIYCGRGESRIEHNVISANTTTPSGGAGAGIAVGPGGYAEIWYNTITDNNSPAGYGGGINADAGASIYNNLIARNNANAAGGGISAFASPSITNNTIVANTAPAYYGGGVYASGYGANPTYTNNIVAFNSSGQNGSASTYSRNNCVYNPGSQYDYEIGIGDIKADPLFVDRVNGDYHLQAGSPCINKGISPGSGLPPFDMDGEARVWDSKVDMGYDEYWPQVAKIAHVKNVPQGALVKGTAGVVTASFPNFFYIEDIDRMCGVRVEKAAHGMQEGVTVTVSGTAHTNSDGEAYLAAATVVPGQAGIVKALGLTNKILGGASFGLQAGIHGASGLNNIGMLIRTTGKVEPSGLANTFILNDGSGTALEVLVPAGITLPVTGSNIIVTGISSCQNTTSGIRRLLRVRKSEDIQELTKRKH